jgi:putative aldouronate transport system permease protein
VAEARAPSAQRKTGGARFFARVVRGRYLLLMLLIPVAYVVTFAYVPMYGVQIAFKDFSARLGIWRSPWVGLDNFVRFFRSYSFQRVITNTVVLSVYSIVAGFPVPILLALALNALNRQGVKRAVQMITYAPHFISTVVMVSIVVQLLNTRFGVINALIVLLGGSTVDFMGSPQLFPHIYVWSGIWQEMGYNSIIYIAALAAIDPTLHEAAVIDGASKVQRTLRIDVPGILPTIVILLILRMGSVINIGFEKAFLMQTPLNLRASEVISTYVYKVGIAAALPNFSFGSAVGLFQSLVGLVLLAIVNTIARRLGETSLW